MGKCNQCGMCCRAIYLRYSKKELAKQWKDEGDRDFILKNWKRISKQKAVTLNPHIIPIVEDDRTGYWYTCKLLKGNQCSIHKNRPEICSGYPWYGGQNSSKDTFLYGENCGYRVDLLTGVM